LVLDNINLEIHLGERVGVIGGNGAGKTTLLRMAAGILRPDSGYVKYFEPTTSLISSNFGIDIELSGRENIFRKARYMGYKRFELLSRVDEIINFSGLENSIDNPMRTYSDGMRVRLVTSVALILSRGCVVMDEGIASADLQFTKQVENKLKEFYSRIPLALIASHSFEFLEQICSKVIYLNKGKIKYIGDPRLAWDEYVKDIYHH
jgi:ABC-type polysaccharide/polyol phosphate transport system ATPase subunit